MIKKKLPSWLKPVIRVAVGAAVFVFLILRTNLHDLGSQLSHTNASLVVVAVLVFFFGLGVSALRWREYLVALDYPMPYPTLFRMYFVGTFFNAFLPTGIGGDAYKAVRIGKARGNTPRVFSSVFLDRFAGIVGLALLGGGSAIVRLATGDRSWVVALAALGALGILGAAGLLLGPGERLLGRGRLIKETGIGGKLREMIRGIHQAGRHPRAAARGMLLGILFQALVIVYHMVLASALHIHVPVLVMASIIVLISVAILIPISLSGLGVLEFVYIHALHLYGTPIATATAFALVLRAVLLLSSGAGGIVYLVFGGDVAPLADSESQTASLPG
ncbi:MAG: hypothetical protein NVSMB57_16790 [Actinomycetota bacterium]